MMIKLSPLELKDFALLNAECHFNPPDDGTDIAALFKEYEVDINFAVRKVNSNAVYCIYVKAEINYDAESSTHKKGYDMFIECMGVFEITDNSMKNEEKMALLSNSGLVMTLNFLRTKLADFTSQFPLGKYLLPSIDLKHIIETKKKSLIKQKVSSSKKNK